MQTGSDFGHMNKIKPNMVIHNSNPSNKKDSEAGGLLKLDF